MIKRLVVIIFLFVIGIESYPNAFSQDSADNRQILTLRGQISQIDWVASSITVRWLQAEGYVAYDETTFFVPDNANVTKGGNVIGLADLQVGASVTVEYINTSPGPLKLINLTVIVQ